MDRRIRQALVAVLLVALAYSVYYHLRALVLPEDDAFITYRYVKNLVDGHGLVYNAGQHVFGSSTPLYVLWLTVLKLLAPGVEIPVLSVRANALFYAAAVIAIVALIERLTRRPSLALGVGILAATNPEMLAISTSGMESFLFVALAVGTLYGIAAERPWLAAGLAGASALARPEGLFILAAWGVCWLLHPKRDPRHLAPALLPLAAWVAFSTPYYGTPVPHSIIAKGRPLYVLTVPQAIAQLAICLVRWGGAAAAPFRSPLAGISIAIAATVLGMHAIIRLNRHHELAAWAVAALFAIQLVFYSQPNMLLFPWYTPFLWLFWVLTVVIGFSLLAGQIAARRPRLGALVLVLGFIVVASQPFSSTLHVWPWSEAQDFSVPSTRQRSRAYQEAAEWLESLDLPSLAIAAPEIGALGYYSQGRIYDACGLVSPEALPFLPVPASQRRDGTVRAISAPFVRATAPDCVVTMPIFAELSLAVDPWFQSQYRLAHTIRLAHPLPVWQLDEIVVEIYLRSDLLQQAGRRAP